MSTTTYNAIQPGEPVVIFTYEVSLVPGTRLSPRFVDWDEANVYDPKVVHLRYRVNEAPTDLTGPQVTKEALRRAVKLEKREFSTPSDRVFKVAQTTPEGQPGLRLVREHLGTAR